MKARNVVTGTNGIPKLAAAVVTVKLKTVSDTAQGK